jgi:hypothetical protein
MVLILMVFFSLVFHGISANPLAHWLGKQESKIFLTVKNNIKSQMVPDSLRLGCKVYCLENVKSECLAGRKLIFGYG